MIISPAMLKTFEECPKKYEFIYLNKILLPSNNKYFEKGKNIHALANYYIKGFDVDKLEKVLTVQEFELWKYLKNCKYFTYELLKSEYQLSIKIGNDWVGGRLDALVKNKNEYYILDYKTGDIPKNPEYDYQTMVYLLCVDKLIKEYNVLKFIYLDLKNQKEIEIEYNSQKRDEYLDKVSLALSNLNNMNLSKNMLRNNNCRCEYSCICI